MTRWDLMLAAMFLAGGCAQREVDESKVYVIYSEEDTGGGEYLNPSLDGEAVADVSSNLLELIIPCVPDVRAVSREGAVHAMPIEFWVAANQYEDPRRRQCLKELLPKHARVSGPFDVAELSAQRGLR